MSVGFGKITARAVATARKVAMARNRQSVMGRWECQLSARMATRSRLRPALHESCGRPRCRLHSHGDLLAGFTHAKAKTRRSPLGRVTGSVIRVLKMLVLTVRGFRVV